MVFFEKSQPAPLCLAREKAKNNGNYNCEEVIERLHEDFKNKCYLCESKGIRGINIEHFIPHEGDKDLKFDWNNLFFACSDCNNIKSNRYNSLLNCTVEEDFVDLKISYRIEAFPKEHPIFQAEENHPKVQETVELLNAIFNGTTPLKRIAANNLKDQLNKEINKFNTLLLKYLDSNSLQLKDEIIFHLSNASAFTAFKKWIIRDHPRLFSIFEQYL
jgi:hypothetical protein